jgi:hypothetical protein
LAFVSTVALPIFLLFSAVPDAAGLELDADALDEDALDGVLAAPLELDDELPHAAAISATAAKPPGASHLFCIGFLPSPGTARLQASPAPETRRASCRRGNPPHRTGGAQTPVPGCRRRPADDEKQPGELALVALTTPDKLVCPCPVRSP